MTSQINHILARQRIDELMAAAERHRISRAGAANTPGAFLIRRFLVALRTRQVEPETVAPERATSRTQ